MDFTQYQNSYLSNIEQSLKQIDHKKLEQFVQKLLSLRDTHNNIYFIGNGGSALNATHFAMGVSIVAKKWENPIRSISLCDSASMLSSLANDYSFEEVFAKLVQIHTKPGDLLVILSSSGNSKNLVNACVMAKEMNVDTFSFLGSNGGELKNISSDYLHIGSEETDPGYAEDIHMIIGHIITGYLEHHC